MKNKKFLIIILIFALTSVLALFLHGCDGGKKPVGDPPEEPFDGFISAQCDPDNLVNDLVKGTANVLRNVSTLKVTPTSSVVNLFTEIQIKINGIDTTASFELNLDSKSPERSAVEFKVINSKNREKIVSINYYPTTADEGYLYINVKDTKLKFFVTGSTFTEMFPLQVDGDSVDATVSAVANVINSCVVFSGNIKYEYKYVGNTCTRHYIFNIDLKKTLQNLLSRVSDVSSSEFSLGDVEKIISNLFGINAKNISYEMPATVLEMEFWTTGGSRSYFGAGILSDLNLKLTAEDGSDKNSLFRGESFCMNLKLLNMKISKDYNNDFTPESSLSDYVLYNGQNIALIGDLKFDNEDTVYGFDLDVLYTPADNGTGDRFSLNVYDKDTEETVQNITYQNNVLTFYLNRGEEKTISIENVNGDEIMNAIIDNMEEKTRLSVVGNIAVIMGSLKMWEQHTLSFNFNSQFFSSLINLDVDSFFEALSAATGTPASELPAQFAAANIDFGSIVINTGIILTVDLNTKFVELTD